MLGPVLVNFKRLLGVKSHLADLANILLLIIIAAKWIFHECPSA